MTMAEDATRHDWIQFGQILFAPAFSSARRDDGIEITFTRSERRVLATLAGRPGRVFSREQLLDAVTEVGSDSNDRSIDFLINRLRRKLGDNARSPQMIGARYGEGYLWLPKPVETRPAAAGAHVVVGPVRGTGALSPALKGAAAQFANRFVAWLAPNFGPSRRVVLDPDCPHRSAFGAEAPMIGIDLTFLHEAGRLECVLRATEFRTGRTLTIRRETIAQETVADAQPEAEALASRIATAIWAGHTAETARSEPLQVAMQNASLALAEGPHGWAESHRRLQALVAENPDNHAIRIMLASNIRTKYIQHGLEIFGSGQDPTAADEAEIEELVTGSLPFVQDDPALLATAADLLFFIGGGYQRMAVELLEDLNRTTVALPHCLMTLGAMRYHVGEVEAGFQALDLAQSMAEPNSEFEVYVICLKCQALMAIDDRDRLDEVLELLYRRRPAIRFLYDILYGRPEALSPDAQGALAMMTLEQARGILIFADYLCARHFTLAEHRENSLKIPRAVLTARFGPEVLPPPMRWSQMEVPAAEIAAPV
jgi:DNA-binding winged helix-turn-helix (wHTH) protein